MTSMSLTMAGAADMTSSATSGQERQPRGRTLDLRHTDVKARPSTIRQPLLFLLPGSVQVAAARPPGDLQVVKRLVHQVVGPAPTPRDVHDLMPARAMQAEGGHGNSSQFD